MRHKIFGCGISSIGRKYILCFEKDSEDKFKKHYADSKIGIKVIKENNFYPKEWVWINS